MHIPSNLAPPAAKRSAQSSTMKAVSKCAGEAALQGLWFGIVGWAQILCRHFTTISLRWEEKKNGFVKIEAVEFTGRNL